MVTPFDQLDGRTGIAQTMRDRYATMTADLGGADNLSYMQRSIVERALWLEYWLQLEECRLAHGGEFSDAKWIQANNALQGMYSKLGIYRAVDED